MLTEDHNDKELSYTNRKKETYYIYCGKTKTGNPKYYASKKSKSSGGTRATSLPDDLEIYERQTNGIVTVRKRVPSNILPWELDLINRLAEEMCPEVLPVCKIEGDALVLYTTENVQEQMETVTMLARNPAGCDTSCWIRESSSYEAVLRFVLRDEEERLYNAERFCFRGSIDDWISVSSDRSTDLELLARNLLPSVGKDSFFELGMLR